MVLLLGICRFYILVALFKSLLNSSTLLTVTVFRSNCVNTVKSLLFSNSSPIPEGEGRLEKGRGNVAVPGYMASANAFLDNFGFVSLINALVCWDHWQWLVSPDVLLKAYILTTFSDRRPPLYRASK